MSEELLGLLAPDEEDNGRGLGLPPDHFSLAFMGMARVVVSNGDLWHGLGNICKKPQI